jgi:Holliday junction resolvase
MGRMSKNKGAAGEREAARVLAELFDLPAGTVYRSCQYAGKEGAGDVLGLPGIHVEVKRTERLRLYEAVDQAAADAGPGDVPVVMHRCNQGEWLAIIPVGMLRKLAAAVKALES